MLTKPVAVTTPPPARVTMVREPGRFPETAVPSATLSRLSVDERRRLIAETAYLKALRRGFRGQRAEQDWLEAEAEVDAMLAHRSAPAPGA
jgi:hypothetical protein